MYICIQVYIHTGIINYDQYIQPDFIIKLTIKSRKPIPITSQFNQSCLKTTLVPELFK